MRRRPYAGRLAVRSSSNMQGLVLSDDERRALDDGPRPPFKVTSHWLSLLDGRPDDPLRRQVVPTLAESVIGPGELSDPLGESDNSPLPRLIRRYTDRALVVITGACALYCRHCFRRRLTGDDFGPIQPGELDDICLWLTEHAEVKELLLSGGDPLTLRDGELLGIIRQIRRSRPDIVFRLATRMPIVEPRRIGRRLARLLGSAAPLWVVLQVNHHRELSTDALQAIAMLQKQGLPVINQTVLLRGVNDSVEILESLSRALVAAGIKPYYLFQGDLAAGTGHFRLPLDEARSLVEELRGRVSGLAMPNFAVDLPGGGGKVPLGQDHVLGVSGDGWRLRTPDGREGTYPDPRKES